MSLDQESRSLSEIYASVPIPRTGGWVRRLFAFAGPAYLVSVGYMDPGNWATDLAGGAKFGYQLMWVLLMSNLMAVLLQTLAARLGVVTGRDLAQACRDYYPRALVLPLWLLCEVAIVACDLAEVLGAAVGLKLLFGVPILLGVGITTLDVLLLLLLSRFGVRRLEAFILVLITTIGACFALEMALSNPDVAAILLHLIPRGADDHPTLFQFLPAGGVSVLGLHGESLYIALGILGATVMPHNLYLHSSLVQSRAVEASPEGKRQACKLNLVDTVVALNCALFVNGAILVLAAAAFHTTGHHDVASLEGAHKLLAPLLGTSLASTAFAVALLCSGQASTITGTLAGQIVMEGFLRIRIRPWLRRMISRGLAVVPAFLVIYLQGEHAVDQLLVLSQVVLSLQLAFAVIPLVSFTSDRRKMGEFVNPAWVTALAVLTSVIIVGLNAQLVSGQVAAWISAAGPNAALVWMLAVPGTALLSLLLLYLIVAPLLERWAPALKPTASTLPQLLGLGSRVSVQVAEGPPTLAQATAYRRIAAALELGPADAPVLAYLHSMRFEPGSELILMHVAESAASRYLGKETSDAESREDEADLEHIASQFRAHGVQTRVYLEHGDASRELARAVHDSGADLVITGSHGHGPLRDLFYGSTVSRLRHQVRCPVLTVPAHAVRPAGIPE